MFGLSFSRVGRCKSTSNRICKIKFKVYKIYLPTSAEHSSQLADLPCSFSLGHVVLSVHFRETSVSVVAVLYDILSNGYKFN